MAKKLVEKVRRSLLPPERIGSRILLLRGHKVLVDADLAELYGVTTRRLNEAVRRNEERFPMDFMFQLTESERDELLAETVHLSRLRFSARPPLVFTEQGVAMLSSVLRSPKAVAVNIEIMRAFVRMRHFMASNDELARKIDAIDAKFESKTKEHSEHIEQIYALLDQLIEPPEPPKKSRIGFRPPEDEEAVGKAKSNGKRGGHKL